MPYPDPQNAPKKKDPLADYFGREVANKPAAPPVAPVPQIAAPVAAPATNVGSNAAQPQQAQRPGPTNFTNFNRVVSANKAVSDREAASYGARAGQNAERAKASLDALRARFGQGVAAGTVADPNNPQSAPDSIEGLRANAAGVYSGPMGFGEVDGADGAVADMLGSEQNLDALGSEEGMQALIQQQNQMGNAGTSKLSASLMGDSGRGDFDALRQRFSPQDDFDKADAAAMGDATKAIGTSKKNAAGWGAQADTAQKNADDVLAARARMDSERQSGEADAAKYAGVDAEFEKALASNATTDQKMNSNYNNFNMAMSPVTQLLGQAGIRDPIQDWGTKTVGGMVGGMGGENGGMRINWQPRHKDVFRQMTPEQWTELKSLPQGAQNKWLDMRQDDVAKGVGFKPGTFARGGHGFYGMFDDSNGRFGDPNAKKVGTQFGNKGHYRSEVKDSPDYGPKY